VKTKSSSRATKTLSAESVPAPELTPENSKPTRRRAATGAAKGASVQARPKSPRAPAPRRRAATPTKLDTVAAATPAPADPSSRPFVTDDDIRMRAYFLYLEYGAQAGSDVDFWLIAERELRGTRKLE
jgi:hypothetical protein